MNEETQGYSSYEPKSFVVYKDWNASLCSPTLIYYGETPEDDPE